MTLEGDLGSPGTYTPRDVCALTRPSRALSSPPGLLRKTSRARAGLLYDLQDFASKN